MTEWDRILVDLKAEPTHQRARRDRRRSKPSNLTPVQETEERAGSNVKVTAGGPDPKRLVKDSVEASDFAWFVKVYSVYEKGCKYQWKMRWSIYYTRLV